MTSTDKIRLPVIDLSLLQGDPCQQKQLSEQLRKAARDIGFFYLRGHGISDDLIRTVQQIARRFFELPEADKLTVRMANSPHFRGYNRAGVEITRGHPDYREQFDIGAERVAVNTPDGPAWQRLQGPKQWPVMFPAFRDVLNRRQPAMTGVDR